jgi:hypothetical protein
MMLVQAAVILGILAQAGMIPSVQDNAPPPPDAPAAAPQEQDAGAPASDFIDVEKVEVNLVGGLAVFSSDFEADPSFLAGISIRAPLPLLSRDVMELEEDAFGLFASIRFSSVERDFEPALEDEKGTVILADLGLDYVFYRDEDFRFLAQAGVQYGHFGNVTDLDNGFGALLGLSGEACLTEGFWVVVTPQISLGGNGDFVVLLEAGLNIRL